MLKRELGSGLWPADTPELDVHVDGRELAGLELVAVARARDAALQRFRTAAFDALRFGADPRILREIVRGETVEAAEDDPTPPDDRPRQGPRTPV